jgi:hypothetical protein
MLKKFSKYFLLIIILLMTMACPNPFESPDPEPLEQNEFVATVEAAIALGGA